MQTRTQSKKPIHILATLNWFHDRDTLEDLSVVANAVLLDNINGVSLRFEDAGDAPFFSAREL